MRMRFGLSAALVVGALVGSSIGAHGQETASQAGLRPGDMLQISVWPDSSLGGQFVVEESGFAYLPFLGRVQAAGVSLDRLRSELRDGYRQAMQNPVVTILPLFRVGVIGAVRQPGIYQVSPSDNLFDVIAMAGGFDRDANRDRVRVVRDGRVIEVESFRQLEEGFAVQAEPLALRSGDQVVVPVVGPGFTWRDALTILTTGATVALVIDRLLEQ